MLYWLYHFLELHHVISSGSSLDVVIFRSAMSVISGFLIVLFAGGPVIRS